MTKNYLVFHFTMHPPYRVTSKRGAKINLFYLYAKRPPLKLFIIIIMSIVFNITTFPTTNIESFYTYSLKSNINFLFINTY